MKLILILLSVIISGAVGFAPGSTWQFEGFGRKIKGSQVKNAQKAVEVKTLGEHPKVKFYKHHLHKLMKQAGKDVQDWFEKFSKRHGIKGSKHANHEFHRQWKRINKWMTTLKKNDTDGDRKDGIPFVPMMMHKAKKWEAKGKEKALKVFRNLQKIWKLDQQADGESKYDNEMPLLGRDEAKIQPKFVKETSKVPLAEAEEKNVDSAKRDMEDGIPLFGRDEAKIQPKFVKDAFKVAGAEQEGIQNFGSAEKKRKGEENEEVPLLGRDEAKIQPEFVSETFKIENAEKENIQDLPRKETEEGKLLFGRDEKKIHPKFSRDAFKIAGAEDGKIQKLPKEEVETLEKIPRDRNYERIVKDLKQEADKMEKKAGKVLPLFREEEEKLSELVNAERKPYNLKEIVKKEDTVDEAKLAKEVEKKLVKIVESKPVSPEEFLKEAKQTAEEWGKSPESLLKTSFAPEDKEMSVEERKLPEEITETMPKARENEWERPAVMGTKQRLSTQEEESLESVNLKAVQKQINEEQKMFEEAEKKWEEEIKQKLMKEKMAEKDEKKTTEQQEIEEDLGRSDKEKTFTPPTEDDVTTVAPEITEHPETKEEVQKHINEEQKMFEEAEKKWEEEIKQKLIKEKAEKEMPKEESEKITEEPQMNEEDKEVLRRLGKKETFTPLIEEEDFPTEAPEITENPNPEAKFLFKFDEEDKYMEKEPEEELREVPSRVYEPPSLFKKPVEEQGFDKMSAEVKPFFKDIESEKIYRKEEQQWERIKNFMKNKLFKSLKKEESKKPVEEEIEEAVQEPQGFIEE